MKDKQKPLKYKCTWPKCGYEFEQIVGTFNKVSSQVICPKCKNFLPTWSGEQTLAK